MVPIEPPPEPPPQDAPASPSDGAAAPAAVGGPAPVTPVPVPPSQAPAAVPPAPVPPQKAAGLTQVAPALSLVLGSLVLLPATTGQLLRPYKWELLLPAFVVLASIAAVLLIAAALLVAFTSVSKPSQVVRGIGSVVGLVALAALVGFVTANFCDSLFAVPRVLNIKFAPVPLVAGKVAEADLELLNKSGKPVHYDWHFNGQKVAGMRTAYLRLPEAPGRYPVEVAVQLLPETLSVDTSASAPETGVAVFTFKTWVDVVADSVTPPPPPISVPCCKGDTCEKQKQKSSVRKVRPTSNQKSCP